MKTSQYDTKTRYEIKRLSRTSKFSMILDQGRQQRKELEATLAKRNAEIGTLRKVIQDQINDGVWNDAWGKLGFTKKA